ncbi:hypothetical protein [Paenarthrobacter sp. AMU7]|uniref:Uncharacterized protein n=1 Tax=Paenarthrobacter sp. AMU7 TaxID=3162492 RepID=A0AB39YW13_9MICC
MTGPSETSTTQATTTDQAVPLAGTGGRNRGTNVDTATVSKASSLSRTTILGTTFVGLGGAGILFLAVRLLMNGRGQSQEK